MSFRLNHLFNIFIISTLICHFTPSRASQGLTAEQTMDELKGIMRYSDYDDVMNLFAAHGIVLIDPWSTSSPETFIDLLNRTFPKSALLDRLNALADQMSKPLTQKRQKELLNIINCARDMADDNTMASRKKINMQLKAAGLILTQPWSTSSPETIIDHLNRTLPKSAIAILVLGHLNAIAGKERPVVIPVVTKGKPAVEEKKYDAELLDQNFGVGQAMSSPLSQATNLIEKGVDVNADNGLALINTIGVLSVASDAGTVGFNTKYPAIMLLLKHGAKVTKDTASKLLWHTHKDNMREDTLPIVKLLADNGLVLTQRWKNTSKTLIQDLNDRYNKLPQSQHSSKKDALLAELNRMAELEPMELRAARLFNNPANKMGEPSSFYRKKYPNLLATFGDGQ